MGITVEGLNAVSKYTGDIVKGIQEQEGVQLALDKEKLKKQVAVQAMDLFKQGDTKGALAMIGQVDPEQSAGAIKQFQASDPATQQGITQGQKKGELTSETEFGSNPNQLLTLQGQNALAVANANAKSSASSKAEINAMRDEDQNDKWATSTWGKVVAQPAFKDFQTYKLKQDSLIGAAQSPSSFGDIASTFAFMKTLDPSSVVRESEFATAAEAGGLLTRVQNILNKTKSGEFLNPAQRADMIRITKHLGSVYKKNYDEMLKPVYNQAKKRGVDIDLIDPYNLDSENNPTLKSKPEVTPAVMVKEVGQTLPAGTKVRQKSTGKVLTVQADGSLK